jgi:hypothetical protein
MDETRHVAIFLLGACGIAISHGCKTNAKRKKRLQ